MLAYAGHSWEWPPGFCRWCIAIRPLRLQSRPYWLEDTRRVADIYPSPRAARVFWVLLWWVRKFLNVFGVTSDDEFDRLQLHVAVSDFEAGEIGIGILDLFFLLLFVHASYIFKWLKAGIKTNLHQSFRPNSEKILLTKCRITNSQDQLDKAWTNPLFTQRQK